MATTHLLDLSHDGVRLLKQGTDEVIGAVALDDPHFETRLEDLRRDAEIEQGGPLLTEVLIPHSEILFLGVETEAGTKAAREKQVREELDGLTPYSLDDLKYIWRVRGKGSLAVAAVARETLEEAERFAAAHGFNPRSLRAHPRDDLFRDRPDFGTVRPAEPPEDETVTRVADLDGLAPTPAPDHAEFVVPPASDGAFATDPAPATGAEPSESLEIAPAIEAADRPEPVAATDFADEDRGHDVPVDDGAADEPEAAPPNDAEDGSASDDVADRHPELAELPPAEAAPPVAETPEPRMTFSSRRPPSEASAVPTSPADTLDRLAARIAMLPDGGVGPADRAPKRAEDLDLSTIVAPGRTARGPADRPAAPPGPPGPRRDRAPARIKAVPPPSAEPPAPARMPSTEAEALTIFGARAPEPRRSGAILPLAIGIIVAVVLALGVWTAFFLISPGGILPNAEAPGTVVDPAADSAGIAADPVGTPLPADPLDPAEIEAPAPDIEQAGGAPAPAQPVGGPAAPVETGRTEADPEAIILPGTVADAPVPPLSVPSGEAGIPSLSGAPGSDADQAPTDGDATVAGPETGQDPEAAAVPGADPAADGDAGTDTADMPAPEDQDTRSDISPADPLQRPDGADEGSRYAATGIDTGAPGADDAPTAASSAAPSAPYDGDEALRAQDAAARPAEPDTVTLLPPETLMPPPPQGLRFDLDPQGRVVATAEGALSPQGVRVTAGAPALRPPPAPNRAAAPLPDETGAADTVLAPEGTVLVESDDAADVIVPVNTGQPPRVPPARPASETETAITPAGENGLPGAFGVDRADAETTVTDGADGTVADTDIGGDAVVTAAGAETEATGQPVPEIVVTRVAGLNLTTPRARPDAPTEPAPRIGTITPDTTVPLARPGTDTDTDTDTALAEAAPEQEETQDNRAATQAATEAAIQAAAEAAVAAASASLAARAEGEPPADVSPYAVARSLRPDGRPRDLAARVARDAAIARIQQTARTPQPQRQVVRTQPAAPQAQQQAVRTQPQQQAQPRQQAARQRPVVEVAAASRVQPRIPTATSAARSATEANVLRLNRMNLIGVYGTNTNRRALVRLTNGRFVKVKVGDRLDGGRVRSIGAAALSYTKGGRSVTLEMPAG